MRKTLQPLVAIGEKIVEDEIAGHGDQRAAGLRLRKRHVEDLERDEQRRRDARPGRCEPTIANSRKRSDTTSWVSFASTRPRKSSATMESSLLSPCSREPKVKGISIDAQLAAARWRRCRAGS